MTGWPGPGTATFNAKGIPQPTKTVLTFTSAPLKHDVTIIGYIKAVIYASCDQKDTDFYVKISEQHTVNFLAKQVMNRLKAPAPADRVHSCHLSVGCLIDCNHLQVSTGWLKASHRRLDEKKSTETHPYHTHTNPEVRMHHHISIGCIDCNCQDVGTWKDLLFWNRSVAHCISTAQRQQNQSGNMYRWFCNLRCSIRSQIWNQKGQDQGKLTSCPNRLFIYGQIYHDKEHPSHIVLPVYNGKEVHSQWFNSICILCLITLCTLNSWSLFVYSARNLCSKWSIDKLFISQGCSHMFDSSCLWTCQVTSVIWKSTVVVAVVGEELQSKKKEFFLSATTKGRKDTMNQDVREHAPNQQTQSSFFGSIHTRS